MGLHRAKYADIAWRKDMRQLPSSLGHATLQSNPATNGVAPCSNDSIPAPNSRWLLCSERVWSAQAAIEGTALPRQTRGRVGCQSSLLRDNTPLDLLP